MSDKTSTLVIVIFIFYKRQRHVNQEAVDHYKRMIDELEVWDIKPVVTLFNYWEIPKELEDAGGWLNNKTIEEFVFFADTCFEKFGKLGMVLDVSWKEPADEVTPADWTASETAMIFSAGWFFNPLLHGEYPEAMRNGKCESTSACELPEFTDVERSTLNDRYLLPYTLKVTVNMIIPG
ncbi:hypothetical protein ACF0H5_017396 [Mactra antiquata]